MMMTGGGVAVTATTVITVIAMVVMVRFRRRRRNVVPDRLFQQRQLQWLGKYIVGAFFYELVDIRRQHITSNTYAEHTRGNKSDPGII